MTPWQLPVEAVFGGKVYKLHSDYRDVLEIFSYFEDPDLPESLKWRIAVALFYEEQIPQRHLQEAMEFLADFLRGGSKEPEKPGPKLLDWEQDGAAIVAEVNKVAGQEIRSLPFVHWWTFLGWFHGIGEGRLSALIGIREKLRKGKKLEPYEKEYYREHKGEVDLKVRYSRREKEEQEALERLLSGEKLPSATTGDSFLGR